ncbi:MAG: hypothetical protein AAB884_00945, partial [Patescibacteria group bacterium]
MAHSNFLGKKTLAALILVGGVLLTILILSGEKDGKKSLFLGIRLGEEKTNPSFDFKTSPPSPLTRTDAIPSNDFTATSNLTDFIAQSYANDFIKENEKNALSGENGPSLPSFDLSPKALENQTSGLLVFKTYRSNEVLTTENNSREKQLAYLNYVDSLLEKHFSGFGGDAKKAIENFLNGGNSSLLNYLTKNIPLFINDLLQLQAPQDLATTHLELLNLWQKKLETYEAVLNFNSDPLKAYLVLQNFSLIAF